MLFLQQLASVVAIIGLLAGFRVFSPERGPVPETYLADQIIFALDEGAALIKEAKREDADILAPHHFNNAMVAYNEARILHSRRLSSPAIMQKATATVAKFNMAIRYARMNKKSMEKAIKLRRTAGMLPADDGLVELWHEAELHFQEAASEYENDRPASGKRATANAVNIYKELLKRAADLNELPKA
ncbi:MAG: hypothetical protein ACRBF0_09780 [Calditrichia bacterium]